MCVDFDHVNLDEEKGFQFKGKVPTPKQIVNYLDEYVVGQSAAKRKLAIAVYNHYKRIGLVSKYKNELYSDVEIEKSNVMLLGNTGTGKTYLVQCIAKMLGVPYYIQDCTKITESGYVGDDVENCLTGLLRNCNFNKSKAELGIVCLDEVDKLAKKAQNVSITRDVSGEGVQQSLLKIVEPNVVGVMPNGGRKHPMEEQIMLNTKNILFIAMGAYCGLEGMVERRTNKGRKSIGFNAVNHDEPIGNILDEVTQTDLVDYGMIPELVGRFPVLVHTDPLDVNDLKRIVTEPKNSILKQYEKLFYLDGKSLKLTDDAAQVVAEAAVQSGTGARGIRSMLELLLNDLMFEAADSHKKKFVVDRDFAENALYNVLRRGA